MYSCYLSTKLTLVIKEMRVFELICIEFYTNLNIRVEMYVILNIRAGMYVKLNIVGTVATQTYN